LDKDKRARISFLSMVAYMGRNKKPSTRDHFRAILEHIVYGVVVQNMDAEIVYINPAAARMLGFSGQEEALEAGRDGILRAFRLYDENGQLMAVDRLPGRRALKGEPEPVRIIRVRSSTVPDSTWRWAWVKASSIQSDDQQLEFVVSIFQEITALKQAELGLKDANQRITKLLERVLDSSDT
jgi:PAS domain S-box-containing protein